MLDECQFCGACCFSESTAYVPLTEADCERLGDDAANPTAEEGGARYMVMRRGHCAALQVGAIAFACSVYERRPAVCRELDRGTPACIEERHLKKRSARKLQGSCTGS
jgi:Fe-S-cluster containining protein